MAALQNTQQLLGRWLADDRFVLGVGPHATVAELKAAYRQLSRQHHPDRLSNQSEKLQLEHQEVFKRISWSKDRLIG